MVGGAVAGRTVGDLAGPRAGIFDQVLHRPDRQRRIDDQHLRNCAEFNDRREVLDRIVGQLRIDARIDGMGRHGSEHDGVAIGCGARHIFGADAAAGAGSVVDDHPLADAFRELAGEDSTENIGRASGLERDHQHDRLGGIVLRRSGTAAPDPTPAAIAIASGMSCRFHVALPGAGAHRVPPPL